MYTGIDNICLSIHTFDKTPFAVDTRNIYCNTIISRNSDFAVVRFCTGSVTSQTSALARYEYTANNQQKKYLKDYRRRHYKTGSNSAVTENQDDVALLGIDRSIE